MFQNSAHTKRKAQVMKGVRYNVIASKFVAKNTVRYETANGDIVTRLHATDVVRQGVDGFTYIDTGGWGTPTTRDRINGALPFGFHVYTSKGAMYLSNGKRSIEVTQRACIGPRGGLRSDVTTGEAIGYSAEKSKIDRWIHKLLEGGSPYRHYGGPFCCSGL